jgi:hypothetical protein
MCQLLLKRIAAMNLGRGSHLALTLLVARVGANDEQLAVPLDQLAVFANSFDRRANFHDPPQFPVRAGTMTRPSGPKPSAQRPAEGEDVL